MSAALTAFLTELETVEKAITGIKNAWADPPNSIDAGASNANLPVIINLLEATNQFERRQNGLAVNYMVGIGVLGGVAQNYPAAWLTVKPLIGPVLSNLVKAVQTQFNHTVLDSQLLDFSGLAKEIPYRGQDYSGFVVLLSAKILEPYTQ